MSGRETGSFQEFTVSAPQTGSPRQVGRYQVIAARFLKAVDTFRIIL
jgi:hypothetical protein